MTTVAPDAMVRPFAATDRASLLGLLAASLGWSADDRHAAYFAWKHEQNPFGASPAWVAVDRDGGLLGFRAFLRWEFMRGPVVVHAVRAVDTATRPDVQRRGVFSRLTMTAVQALTRDGVEFVFNTPNPRSLSGYIRMGWQRVGRLPVSVRPASVSRLARVAQARGPAEKWSLPTEAGMAAGDAFVDREPVERLLGAVEHRLALQTRRSVEYLRWRYGFPDLRYRVLTEGPTVEDGMVIFRLRRRGRALEAVICDVLLPGGDAALGGQLCKRVLAGTGADYAIRSDRYVSGRGFLPLPGQGPLLTWRALTDPAMPPRRVWDLGLGDVELF
jgi:GNAT superfamily N-acetyltransferase